MIFHSSETRAAPDRRGSESLGRPGNFLSTRLIDTRRQIGKFFAETQSLREVQQKNWRFKINK
jgi:hypothetical protein